MAKVYSFDLDKGTDWSIDCQYKNEDCTVIDISTASFSGKIRQSSFTGSVVGTFTIIITDGINGKFTVSLNSTQTAALPTGSNYYDVEMILNSKTTRMFEGIINCRAEVTY